MLHAPPQILRRDRPHLHEQLAVTRRLVHPALRILVLLLSDFSVAQKKLSEGVFGRVRSGDCGIEGQVRIEMTIGS